MSRSRVGRRWRSTVALVAVAVFVGACTAGEADPATTATSPAGSGNAHALMTEALGGTQSVQDFIVHLDMSVLAGEELIPILDQVTERARAGAGDPVELVGGFTMRPVDSLQAEMVDRERRPLPSLSVDFALLESTPERTDQLRGLLAAALGDGEDATAVLDAVFDSDGDDAGTLVEIVGASYADRFTHAGPGDASALDLSFLVAADSERLVSVHLFGQTLPGDPAVEDELSAHDLFAYRWNRGLVKILGSETEPIVAVVDVPLESGDGPESRGPAPDRVLTEFSGDHPSVRNVLFAAEGNEQVSKPTGGKLRLQDIKGFALMTATSRGFIETYLRTQANVPKLVAQRGRGSFAPVVSTTGEFPKHCIRSGYERDVVIAAHSGDDKKPCLEDEVVPMTTDNYATMIAVSVMRKVCVDEANRLRRLNEPQEARPPTRRNTQGQEAMTGADTTAAESTTIPDDPLADPQSPPPIECGPPSRPVKRSAGAVGDVHLVTLDQVFYDNQAAGEFLVFDNGLAVVQMRTEPWEDSDIASVATAVGVEVDGRVVSMHAADPNGVGETWIDGEQAELERGVTVALGDGGLLWTGTGWVVVWSDGTRLTVDDRGDRLMFTVYPSDLRVEGMLGDGDGDPDNDLVTSDGTLVPAETAIDPPRFYAIYIDSWRITADESLFHYGPGESSEGFQLAGFPDHTFVFEDLIGDGAGEAAEAACREGGITRPELIAACVYDLVVAGDESFVYDHYVMEDSLPDAPTPDSASPDPTPAVDGPNVLTVGDVAIGFEASPGWCTSDEISLGAAHSFTDESGRQVDISVQYVDAEDPLVSVVLQFDRQAYAWISTTVAPPSGSLDEHAFGGGVLTLAGSAFMNEPFDPGVSPNLPLPAGSAFVPFELRIRCTP